MVFDLSRFQRQAVAAGQYERQIKRLIAEDKEVVCIEKAVRGAIQNLDGNRSQSFVIYGEPQSGKTEMMICLTAKLLDNGYEVIIHLLNDSVDLLGQNLGRFKSSGLAPAARNFTEVLDPAVKIRGQQHVIFCKKNGSDLEKLQLKLDGVDGVVVIDDEADYASPNSRINSNAVSPVNNYIRTILGKSGVYIGVTATPARLDLNNTFENDSRLWVDFPPHSKYTGQDVFFPIDHAVKYIRTLIPDSGDEPKYARQALFSFLVNTAYLNLYVNTPKEMNYSFLVHTSGKKADHKSDWNVVHNALDVLVSREGKKFESYVEVIWSLSTKRYADADANAITSYVLDNIPRHSIVVLNSERDWKDNSGAATDPTTLFTIIIGGNIVSRGVTFNNLLSMFFTRDVKHKIQQDTYIQRARMFGSRGAYLRFFELTIPENLYLDWHRCFVFHRLALTSIKEGLGSLVWLGDRRIAPVASSSIDRSTVDLNSGEMSFGLFSFNENVRESLSLKAPIYDKITSVAMEIGPSAFPDYLRRYIFETTKGNPALIFIHPPTDISGYADAIGLDKEQVIRKRGFIGPTQIARAPVAVEHHLIIFHNGDKKARLFYKFTGSIQFIKNVRR